MLLLALDTSTRQSSLSLSTEEELLAEYTWYAGGNHSVELFDHLQRLCSTTHLALAQLDLITVATGPGSFNAVRVALATAKSLAFALQKPLLGVTTLDCIAYQQALWPGPVCALLEAGRGEVYTACYSFALDPSASPFISYRLQRLSEYLLLPTAQLATFLREQSPIWFPDEQQLSPWLFAGEISPSSRQILLEQFSPKALFAGPVRSSRRSSALATLGLQRWQAGEADDPLALEPFYLRRPSITKSTRKQPLFGGASQISGEHDTEREEGALRH